MKCLQLQVMKIIQQHDKELGGLETIDENITGEERWKNVLEMLTILESPILSEERLCYVAENHEEAT